MAAGEDMNPVPTPRALEAFTLPNPGNPGTPRLMLRIRPHLAIPEEDGSAPGPTPPRTPGKPKRTKITLCLKR
ncbi:hypothetical protein MMC32_000524 [Xylographa parallela]|nr:hypothetical protein [Xylographa parallela]